METSAPSDEIEASWLETYEKQRHVIWWQLIELNCNIFVIEKIEKFPFNLFLSLFDDRIFWHLTKSALVEKSIMIIWRVVADKGAGKLTLRHFKNEILRHSRDAAAKTQLRTALKNIDFENRMEQLEVKIRHIRHNYLAHLNDELHTNPDPQRVAEAAINLTELKDLLNTSRELFDTLCFNQYHLLWYWGYSDSHRERQETDIEKLLDCVAQNSYLLNMPERNSTAWESRKQKCSEDELAMLNIYRRKFGLPAV